MTNTYKELADGQLTGPGQVVVGGQEVVLDMQS